jgi:hypothetical protein
VTCRCCWIRWAAGELTDLIDVVDTPSYDTLEHLLAGVAKAYG